MSLAGPKVITLLAPFRLCIMLWWTSVSRVQRFTRGGGGTVGGRGEGSASSLLNCAAYLCPSTRTHTHKLQHVLFNIRKSQEKKSLLNI